MYQNNLSLCSYGKFQDAKLYVMCINNMCVKIFSYLRTLLQDIFVLVHKNMNLQKHP